MTAKLFEYIKQLAIMSSTEETSQLKAGHPPAGNPFYFPYDKYSILSINKYGYTYHMVQNFRLQVY